MWGNAISELIKQRTVKPFRGRKDITKMFGTTYNDRGKSITRVEKSQIFDFLGNSRTGELLPSPISVQVEPKICEIRFTH